MSKRDGYVAASIHVSKDGRRVINYSQWKSVKDIEVRRTGRRFTARFAHVWTLQDRLIVRLQQWADTVQLAHALVATDTTA